MDLRVLSVLMWKHAVVRVRRFINTAVDFLSPLMFFLLLFAFKDVLNSEQSNPERDNSVAYTEILPLTDVMPGPYWLQYYPDSPLTNSLMEDVGAKLNLKKLDKLDHTEKGYIALSNETRLDEIGTNVRLLEAVVIFQKMSGETWPDRLNYTIRMKGDFQTHSYETEDNTPGPHRMFGVKYGTFMRIQWAIDTSFIRLLTGVEVPQALSVQEFPYSQSSINTGRVVICALSPMLCWLSLMLPFVFLMSRLLQERTSGIQELMTMVGVSANNLALTHYLNVLPSGLVFSIGGAILYKASSNPLLLGSSGFLIFLFLLMYYNTIVALAFVCSYISKGTQYAVTLSVLAYVLLWIPYRMLEQTKLPYPLILLTGFFPHVPSRWFWSELASLELYGDGIGFGNIAKSHGKTNCSVLISFFILMLQFVFFSLLAWYLSLVRPGKYGQALPWNFPCKQEPKTKIKEKKSTMKEQKQAVVMSEYESSGFTSKYTFRRLRARSSQTYFSATNDAQYWTKGEVRPNTQSEEEDPMTYDPRFFEETPPHAETGIKIVNVSKIYPKHQALRNVSLAVQKGEITVLLGHNGAGKTTLMSIITGMTSATEGKVYVNGMDTVKQRHELRNQLGLCPQHNLFFEDLTVRENIMFFTLLKRGTYSEARASSAKLADQLSISGKLTSMTSQLSGGMKRRVQLACALAGGADVLVLDEPTSGLDVETRRSLWDLLLSLRGERTVLLTTHFMEEADALGDRVAALHAGVLKCFATTMYLKKAVGTGYRLSFTTVGTPKEAEITNAVTKHIPDATLKEKTINSISYNLPARHSKKFSKMFTSLEASKSELGIDTIGVGVSTLEEVFLKLCSDIDTTLTEDEVDNPDEPEVPPDKLTGSALLKRQFYVLMQRQLMFINHKKWTFLIWQIVLPIIVIFVMTKTTCNKEEPASRSLPMNLDMFGDRSDRRVMYHVDLPDINAGALRQQYPKVKFEDTKDVATAVLRTGQSDVLEYNKYLVGVEVNETDAKILYTTTVRHAAPVALNVLSNMLATRFISWADGKIITTLNNPILREQMTSRSEKQPKDIMSLLTWGICVTFILMSTNVNSVSLPCKERATGARHIHIMSGCSPELYWCATLTFHMTVCVVGLLLPITLAALLLETDNTLNQLDMLATFIFILILGSLAFFAFMYLVSFYFGEKGTSIILVSCIIIFGVLVPSIGTAYSMIEEKTDIAIRIVEVLFFVATPSTLVNTATSCLFVGRINAMCALMRPRCPDLGIENDPNFDVDNCCAGGNAACYYCFSENAPGSGILALFLQFVIMMTMVFLTQRGIFNGLTDKLWNILYRPQEPAQQDEMVRAEKAYVSKAINMRADKPSDPRATPPRSGDGAAPVPVTYLTITPNFSRPEFYNSLSLLRARGVYNLIPKERTVLASNERTVSESNKRTVSASNERTVSASNKRTVSAFNERTVSASNERTLSASDEMRCRRNDAEGSGRPQQNTLTALRVTTTAENQIPDAMLVDDIHKNYVHLIKRNINAVKGISFSVKKGECFGLLGVNGAGKSTTFKMLTTEECATRGRIYANGHHLKRGNSQYLQTLGYCPQFFGLDMFLTAEENLTLLLTLRGFDQQLVDKEVKSWIGIVGLEKYAKRRVEGYSGGCVRRLGAAAALCGRAELALLDEPSAGVDVAARRRLWAALRRALRHKRAIVITSHSMDEMEALCSRIAIMAGGRVRALGTAAGLRAAHAKGHAVMFKVKHALATDQVDGAKTHTNKLKGKLQETFNCTLKDEHKTMLHYHINETMRYSDLFTKLEALQSEFPDLIEDYSVTETTLEEVFLSFAKEQHTGPQAIP